MTSIELICLGFVFVTGALCVLALESTDKLARKREEYLLGEIARLRIKLQELRGSEDDY